MKRISIFVLFVFILLIYFFTSADAATVDISMMDSFFVPVTKTINVGDTVRWTNNGNLPHTSTSGVDGNSVNGIWDSGTLLSDQTFSFTFDEPGTFPYHCTFHWFRGMKGTIIVQSGNQSEMIPVPVSQQIIGYAPVVMPELNSDPLQAKPVGIGSIAIGGGTFTLRIGLNKFSGPVDIYGAFMVSTAPNVINVLQPSGTSFIAFTFAEILNAIATGIPPAGAVPWKANVMGPVDEQLFNTLISNVPPGTYTVYLFVTPAGSINNFYLWTTVFVSP